MLEARAVTWRCNGKALVNDVSLRLEPGKLCVLLGPNGAGKSTLVKLMSGQLSPSSGEVLLGAKNLNSYSPPELAIQRAVLAQSRTVGFPFTAMDVVLMGRHPHAASQGESEEDRNMAEQSLAKTDSGHLATRIYNTLSGGEGARVDLARILAQNTEILMLDEPTNHLDPRHQVSALRLCRELTRSGRAVVVCMHDLNLAAQFADHILILKDGNTVAQGSVEETLTADLLEEVYETPFALWSRPGGGLCILPDIMEDKKIVS